MQEQDTKLQILYDHYKDTFGRIKEYEDRRDRFLFLSLLVASLTYFQASSPKESKSVLAQILSSKLGVTSSGEVSVFIGSIIWFALFILIMQYFQAITHITRQYRYHETVESQISDYYSKNAFIREGAAYHSEKTFFSGWTKHVYKSINPIILLSLIVWKALIDVHTENMSKIPLFFNLFIATCITISIILHLIQMHLKK